MRIATRQASFAVLGTLLIILAGCDSAPTGSWEPPEIAGSERADPADVARAREFLRSIPPECRDASRAEVPPYGKDWVFVFLICGEEMTAHAFYKGRTFKGDTVPLPPRTKLIKLMELVTRR
jgi:hypothetical protein